MLTEREKFIIDSVIMVTSPTAKSIPRIIRQALLKYIRDTKYPSVTNGEWTEIAQDINSHKDEVMSTFRDAFKKSLTKPHEVMKNMNLLSLDKTIRENMDRIDLSGLKDMDLNEEDRALFLAAKQMKRDFDKD